MKAEDKEAAVLPDKSSLRENTEAIIIALILALFIRTFIVQPFKIPSGSMKNTLLIGDHILVNKFIYGIRIPFTRITMIPVKKPERGDIVVFKYPRDPSKDFIKRVVGVAGDRIEIKDKKVYVNGKHNQHDYIIHTDANIIPPGHNGDARDRMAEVTVPEGSIFVMGDNRDESHDSRFWGFVKLDAMVGKAFIIYWSWNGENKGSFLNYIRWERVGDLLK